MSDEKEKYTCEKCGESIKNYRTLENGTRACKTCYYTKKFYEIFGYDLGIKVFVDVFILDKTDVFMNVITMDFLKMEFNATVKPCKERNLNKAKYDAILEVCKYFTSFQRMTIFHHFKTIQNHADQVTSSKKLKNRLYELKKLIKKGLTLKYIDEELNYAKLVPYMFKIFHKFEDYNRTMYLQKRDA